MEIDNTEIKIDPITRSVILCGFDQDEFDSLLPELESLIKKKQKGNSIVVTISETQKPRSVASNSKMWKMLRELSIKLYTSQDELYMHYITTFGFYEERFISPDEISSIQKDYKYLKIKGEIDTEQGKKLYIHAYKGTSKYSQKEFNYFLDMIQEDALELGIPITKPKPQAG